VPITGSHWSFTTFSGLQHEAIRSSRYSKTRRLTRHVPPEGWSCLPTMDHPPRFPNPWFTDQYSSRGALNACARLTPELYITLHLVSTDPHELTFDQGVTAPDRWCRCRPISIQGTPSSLRWTGSCGGLLPFPGTGEYLPTKSTTRNSANGPRLPTGCYSQPAPHLSTTSSGQASTFHQKLKKRELAGVRTHRTAEPPNRLFP
jgi:hypothetical protein